MCQELTQLITCSHQQIRFTRKKEKKIIWQTVKQEISRLNSFLKYKKLGKNIKFLIKSRIFNSIGNLNQFPIFMIISLFPFNTLYYMQILLQLNLNYCSYTILRFLPREILEKKIVGNRYN